MLTIDIHTHILPKQWPNLKEKYGYGGFVELKHTGCNCAEMVVDGRSFRKVQSNTWCPTARIQDCDQTNVTVQVLSTVPVMFCYWAKAKDTLDLSQRLNDHIAEVVSENPGRFIGLGTVPMQSTELAIQELTRCVKQLGLSGIQIGTHINEMNLNAPQLFDVFAAAEDLGAAVFVHPWDMMGQRQMTDYWLPWLVGMPAETSRAICSLIFGGVLERLPKLRIAFAHGGGSFPANIGRIEHAFKVRPDLCAKDNPHNPRNYLDKIYLDTLVHEPKMLDYLIDTVGYKQLALGTDYPFPLGDLNPGHLIHEGNYSEEMKQRMLSGTALEWLNLSKDRFL